MKLTVQLLSAAWLWILASVSHASLVPSVDYVSGTGTASVYFVIDWNDGPDDNLNWQFRYNPGDFASVYDAMAALDAGDPNLSFTYDTTYGAPFLTGMDFADGGTSHSVDTTTASAPRDWISFWLGDASGTAWSSSGTGISATPVTEGYAYGFNYEPDWNQSSSEPNAIPEPGMFAVCLGGAGVLLWLRRLRARR